MAFMFEKLEVHQKAVTLADQTAEMSQSFPCGFCFLSDQLNRAALSIATNLAEGNSASPSGILQSKRQMGPFNFFLYAEIVWPAGQSPSKTLNS